MFQTMFNRGAIPALEAMVHFTSVRHKAIANNIANAETVGYKAMDAPAAEFKKALEMAFQAQHETRTGVFELEATRGIRPTGTGLEIRFEESADTGILRHIENNVDLDLEMGRLAKNAGVHNLAATLLSHQLRMLETAIRERLVG